MNDLFRQCNKRAYEVEGAINDIYCDKTTALTQSQVQAQIDNLNELFEQLNGIFTNQISKSDTNYRYWTE